MKKKKRGGVKIGAGNTERKERKKQGTLEGSKECWRGVLPHCCPQGID